VSAAGPGNTHDAFLEDAAAYVLGALPGEEHESFQVHLRGCAQCREEVARLQVVADALPLASPQLSASPELKGRVMSALGGEEVAAGAPEPRRSLRGGWRARDSRGGSGRRWTFAAVPALAVIAVALAVIAIAQSGGSSTSTRVVRAQVLAPGATASLRITGGHGQLQISGMPQAPARHTYQVWIERGNTPQPTDSLFTVSSAGTASVAVPGSLAGAKAVLVTAEPLGGSKAPTRAPILIAPVS
jgi:anti-sigma-K factor RskA